MELYATGKEMLLMAALRAAITLLTFIGRGLDLTEAERRAVLGRVEVAPLAPTARSGA
ncbi:MAG: hypothetical protein WAS21_23995 [Geminicoccaceae bacterium]